MSIYKIFRRNMVDNDALFGLFGLCNKKSRSKIWVQCSVHSRFVSALLSFWRLTSPHPGKMARFLASKAETWNSDEKYGRDAFLILFDVLSVDMNRIVESFCFVFIFETFRAFKAFHGKTVDEHLIGITNCKPVDGCFRIPQQVHSNQITCATQHAIHFKRQKQNI